MERRKFLKNATLTTVALSSATTLLACPDTESDKLKISSTIKPSPIAICTWGFVDANAEAGKALDQNITALDAAIKGVSIEEKDIKNTTVGIGATPNRNGKVTLDACVMDSNGNCGSVMCVENIVHVSTLAKLVMTETPHVILAGKGAEEFAYQQGLKKENLLTEDRKKAWQEWKKTSKYQPIINIENHDTIGMLTLDSNGDIAGTCTTSGLAYKMNGRVGDSPVIGSGLFVDNQIGAAVATGMGEAILKSVGCFLIVELMRQGKTPQQACEEAIKRIVSKNNNYKDFQAAFIALNKAGETGAFCIHKGFAYMKYQNGENIRIEADYYVKA
jgi:N4-(beta-N-acetylglucosaminyl)-L-asparaginase